MMSKETKDSCSKKAVKLAMPSPLTNHQLVIPGPGRPKGSKNKSTKDRKLEAECWSMLTRLKKLLTRVENKMEADVSSEDIAMLLKLASEIRGWIQELAKILGTYAPKKDIHVEIKLQRTEIIHKIGDAWTKAITQSGMSKDKAIEVIDIASRLLEEDE